MYLGIIKNHDDARIAITPDGCRKLKDLGVSCIVERDAGNAAGYSNEGYSAHAEVMDRDQVLTKADLLISVEPLEVSEYQTAQKNTLLISMFQPFNDSSLSDQLLSHGFRVMSLDMIPRISIAQTMDVLSSMASIAGYKAVIDAASHLDKYIPMMMTAAGTVKPAKVVILGAGVAGLQAIATAKRLGAIVEVSDTRSAVKEEVQSLGGKFIEVEGAVEDTGAGGYGVQQSEEFLQRQRALVQQKASEADIVITTAQVRGRKAPMLIPEETVEKMRSGSVIVDLAASSGGNCAMTKDREIITAHGVTIIGNSNLAETMPKDASMMFSNNVINFLKVMIKEGELVLDMENEIISSTLHKTST